MNSHTTRSFREMRAHLPEPIRQLARQAYRHFQQDPRHPGLDFKKVHATRPIYSARISRDYRAVGVIDGDTITWFWIGPHREYERLLTRL